MIYSSDGDLLTMPTGAMIFKPHQIYVGEAV